MSKMRADSTWNALTPEQRQTLESWLFEENVSYQEARERARKEWGVTCSVWSVSRYYQRRLNERVVEEMAEAEQVADEVNGTKAEFKNLKASALKLIGKRLLERAVAAGDVKELAALGKLVSESEWREIQQARLALARERFEFNAAEAALAQLPHVEEMTEEDLKRERARALAIKHNLFGPDLPT
jgi:hypothetical protein